MFQDKMVTPAIPERVYALCKIVEKGPISSADLKEKMEPAFLQNANNYFNDYRTAAEELKLITTADNMITLAVQPEQIASIEAMRKYINGVLETVKDGQFYRVTAEYYAMGRQALLLDHNLSTWGPLMSQKIGLPVDATNMRAWRFWVSFLGFGYLQGMFFIPNASVFLYDLIQHAPLEKNKIYSFGEFIEAIRPSANIVINAELNNRVLNYGVSNGLRALHDMGVIKMEHVLDQQDIWSLYPLNAHKIANTVTNITICK